MIKKTILLILLTSINLFASTHYANINLNNQNNSINVQSQQSNQQSQSPQNSIPDVDIFPYPWVSFFNSYCGTSFSNVNEMYSKFATEIISCNQNLPSNVNVPQEAHGIPYIYSLYLGDKYILENLNGFVGTNEIRTLGIESQINSVAGLGNVSGSIAGTLNLDRNNIYDLTGLNNITSIYQFQLSYSNNLRDLSGLENLTTVERYFGLIYTRLESLNGLDSLTTVGSMNLAYNQWLTDISALSNITTVLEDMPGSIIIDDKNYAVKMNGSSYLCNAGFIYLYSPNTGQIPQRSNLCN